MYCPIAMVRVFTNHVVNLVGNLVRGDTNQVVGNLVREDTNQGFDFIRL